MSIAWLYEFWRAHRTQILFAIVAFLFGSMSFLSGYLVALEYQTAPIIIEQCSSAS
jgi:hypothetical protein